MSRALALVAALAVARSHDAHAQAAPSSRLFVTLGGGVQSLSPTLESGSSFSAFGETAVVATNQSVGLGGMLMAGAGYRVKPRFAVGLAVSGFRHQDTGLASASVPSPIFARSPNVTNLQSSEMTRREIGYHPEIVWFVPKSDRLELAFSAGPSFIHLNQPVLTISMNTNTQTPTAGEVKESGTAVGGHAGIEFIRYISNRMGVEGFARYSLGWVDLPSVSSVKAGGLQTGVGFQVRF